MQDMELVKLCIKGDNNAFADLLSRYKNLVYSIVLRMVNDREEANDLAQEVFIKLYKNLEKYSDEYKFSTWTMKITTNHVIDHRRKRVQETTVIDDALELPESSKTPEEAYLAKEQREMLQEVLEQLPDMYKIPIVLYHQQGLSYQEIAEIIEEPLSKVKNRIFRGRKILKDAISQRGEIYGM